MLYYFTQKTNVKTIKYLRNSSFDSFAKFSASQHESRSDLLQNTYAHVICLLSAYLWRNKSIYSNLIDNHSSTQLLLAIITAC